MDWAVFLYAGIYLYRSDRRPYPDVRRSCGRVAVDAVRDPSVKRDSAVLPGAFG